jgi:signal peptidase II
MDRLAKGYVVDFLDFYVGVHHWPAFNIADSAITVGVFLLLICFMRNPKSKREKEIS